VVEITVEDQESLLGIKSILQPIVDFDNLEIVNVVVVVSHIGFF